MHVDELDRRRHEVARKTREARRHARASKILERLRSRLGRHSCLERAGPEAEQEELGDIGGPLPHDVEPSDAAVDNTVLHVFRDVVCAHEQRLDGRVAARERERAVARRLGAEPGVVEQLDRGLAQAALRGNGDSQAGRFLRRRSARP